MEQFLKQTYYDPDHPAGFSSVYKLKKAAIEAGFPKATFNAVKQWLHKQEVYSVTKSVRTDKEKSSSRIYVAGLNAQWDADLIDFSKSGDQNDGYRYILLCIDIFSRYCMTRKLKSKSPVEVSHALKDIFDNERKPKFALRSDAGMEFCGVAVQKLLNQNNIKHIIARNVSKANYSERCIKSIRTRIFKYFIHRHSHRWIDVLPKITHSYNNSIHRSIACKPVEITTENENCSRIEQYLIRHNLDSYGRHKGRLKSTKSTSKGGISRTKHSVSPLYKVGQLVRISTLKHIFAKEYHFKWSREIFKISKVFIRDSSTPVYRISDMSDDPVIGTFYQSELSPAYEPDDGMYAVEKVLKSRGRGKNKQYLVKWHLYGDKHNSWVHASTLKPL